MPRHRNPEPLRFCEFCGETISRKMFPSGLEPYKRFLARKTCGQSCGNRRHVVTVAGQRSRAAKFRGDTCERCGFQGDGLHAHHRDGDVTNSVASNIETVCASCHISGHWAAKRANGVAA